MISVLDILGKMDTERLTKKALENLRRNDSFRSKERGWGK